MLSKHLNISLYADFYPKYACDKFSPLLTPTAHPLETTLPLFPPFSPPVSTEPPSLVDHPFWALYCDQKRLTTQHQKGTPSLEELHTQFSIRVAQLRSPLLTFAHTLQTLGFHAYGGPVIAQEPLYSTTVHTHWLHFSTNAVAITHIHPHFFAHKNSFSLSLHFPDASRVYYLSSNRIDETLPTTILTTIGDLMEELSDWQLKLLTC